MSRASMAIAGFVLGCLCSTLFSEPQAEHKGSSTPSVNWPDLHGTVFVGGGVANAGTGVDHGGIGSVPFFNTLDHMPIFKKYSFVSTGQSLDGLNCEDCQFNNAGLRYGGGVLNLKGSTFSGTTELQLEGAAANTIALLEFLKAIPEGQLKYKLPIPNKPITRKFASTATPSPTRGPIPPPAPAPPQKMDFTAPYIGPR